MIILTDRYPQIQNYGFNDGPLLANAINSQFIEKNTAKLELNLYSYSNVVYPDIVIKLLGNTEFFIAEKNDMTYDLIKMKQDIIKIFHFQKIQKCLRSTQL